MSTHQVRFRSPSLNCQTEFWVHLPDKNIPPFMVENNPHYKRPTKLLILLHGYSGDCTDWLFNAPVADFSLKYNLAVVMPTGGTQFYLDTNATCHKVCSYVGEDLVNYMRDVFGLSAKKEDTLIGGFSMGGFGAIHTALTYPDTFGGVIASSSALIQHGLKDFTPDMPAVMANYDYYVETFGDLKNAENTDINPEVLFLRNKEQGKENPKFFMCVGAQDFLNKENHAFKEFLEANGADLQFEEGDGVHHWSYVVPHFYNGLDYMLDKLK